MGAAGNMLMAALLETENAVLIEASPYDGICNHMLSLIDLPLTKQKFDQLPSSFSRVSSTPLGGFLAGEIMIYRLKDGVHIGGNKEAVGEFLLSPCLLLKSMQSDHCAAFFLYPQSQ